MESTTRLIQLAQKGDDRAANQLLRVIRDHHMKPRIYRYIDRNVLIPNDDVESEFLLGCWLAIPRAKLDVGNPLSFITWKGQMKVASLFAGRIKKGIRFTCLECGADGRIGFAAKVPVCSSCGSTDLWTTMVEVADLPTKTDQDDIEVRNNRALAAILPGDHVWQIATMGIQIEELRAQLSGRVLELFDILVLEGVNSGSSQNYIKEIAGRWGVSTAAVSAHLRKLRAKVLEYREG